MILALRVLRRATSLMQTSLLTLHRASITSQETGLLQRLTIARAIKIQRTRDSETERARLPGRATTLEIRLNIELTLTIKQRERSLNLLLMQLIREIILQATTIALKLAGTRHEPHPNDRALTTPNRLDRPLYTDRLRLHIHIRLGLLTNGDKLITDGIREILGRGLGSGDILRGSDIRLLGLRGIIDIRLGHWATTLIS